MLNVDMATGKRLDNLVGVLGVKRKGNSAAKITATINYLSEITIENNQVLSFLDISGNIWYLIDPSKPLEQNPLQGKINLLDGVNLVSQNYGEITNDSIGSQFVSAWITTYDNEDYSTTYLNYAGFTISDLEFFK